MIRFFQPDRLLRCFLSFVSVFVLCLLSANFIPKYSFAEDAASPTASATASAATLAQPFVPNGGFELAGAGKLPEKWSGSPENFAHDTDVFRSGCASLRWQNTDSGCYALSHAYLGNVQPGKAYMVSGWVRTKNVSGGDASICVEWSGSDGKWLGGSYLHGVKGTWDWKQISGIVHVPEEASKVHITCYGTKGAVGTAWFDDLEIQPFFPPVVTAITTDCYRAQTIGGVVRVFVGLGYSAKEFSEADREQVVLTAADASTGKVLQTLRLCEWHESFLSFSLNADELPEGQYTLTVQIPKPGQQSLESASLKLTKRTEFPERKVFFDEHQRLIVEGQPFFPLGLYFHNPTHEDIERLADSPFNCIMSYHPLSRETLDELYAHGIRSIYSVKDYYEGLAVSTDEEGRRKTTEKILALKDHPAIIAWYINDELPLSMKDVLAAHRDLVEELDPDRPAWSVLYQIHEIRDYLPTYDVVGTDPYPIGSKKPASTAYDWAKMTHDACFGCRPCWQVPQYFNWSNYSDQKPEARMPSYEEMRAMTWMGMAGGANGIVGYSYFDFFRNFAGRDGTPEAKKESMERSWSQVCKIGEEIKRYESVLLSTEVPEPIETVNESAPEIVTRSYALGGETWLMMVNTATEKKIAQFTVPEGWQVKNAQDWPGLKLTRNGGFLIVELDGLTPAFLQFGLQK